MTTDQTRPLGAVRCLVTGGAGFIGSTLVDELLRRGHHVVVLDSLDPQVHGPRGERPEHLDARAELVVGDVRDAALVGELVGRVDVVVHLAAAVGNAQSMYQIERFVDVNCRGTAILLDACLAHRERLRRLVVASSMSLYGEGRCRCARCGEFDPAMRSARDLSTGDFEVHCPTCGAASEPVPTPETSVLEPTTIYAVTKRDQEELVTVFGAAYGIPTVALRLFNTYGPRQSLSNPYTGVGAIFSSRLLGGAQPVVFEDGLQTRDFVHVTDVARAFAAAVEAPSGVRGIYNVGTGVHHPLLDLGAGIADRLGVPWRPEISHQFRSGDIRHCAADTTAIRRALGWRAEIPLADGIGDLVEWVRHQTPEDKLARAMSELKERGLVS